MLAALDTAHPDGGIGYLRSQASENPTAFMTLVGKVLPMTVTGHDGGAFTVIVETGVPRG